MLSANAACKPRKYGVGPLKITRIETVVVNAVHRNWIFVKVLTDQAGLHGWGEATLEWKTRAVKGAIDDLAPFVVGQDPMRIRSEEHTSELQSRQYLVCRLLLEKNYNPSI